MEDQETESFFDNYNLRNLRQQSCYKSPTNLVCIDLLLTNTTQYFQNSCFLKTGLSDFHLMTWVVMRKNLQPFTKYFETTFGNREM